MTNNKHCAECGESFFCGREQSTCWCVDLPHLPSSALDIRADCLCPRCLRARVERHSAPGSSDSSDGKDRTNDPN